MLALHSPTHVTALYIPLTILDPYAVTVVTSPRIYRPGPLNHLLHLAESKAIADQLNTRTTEHTASSDPIVRSLLVLGLADPNLTAFPYNGGPDSSHRDGR